MSWTGDQVPHEGGVRLRLEVTADVDNPGRRMNLAKAHSASAAR